MKKNNYDVFISFKNTEEDKDRELAQKVYDYLTKNGLKVFFSNVTLAENGTDDWDEAIYKTIEKSKIFIAVGTKKTYMELKHPQSERTAFLTHKRSDKKKVIYSYIGGSMTIDDLPNELRNIQCFQDKNKDDLANLLKFVLNSLEKTSPKKPKRKPKSTDISLDNKFNFDDLIKNKTFENHEHNMENYDYEIENQNFKIEDFNKILNDIEFEPRNNIEIQEKNSFIPFLIIILPLLINLTFLSIYSLKYLIVFILFNLVIGLFNIEKFIFIFGSIQILTFIGGLSYYFFM